MLAAAPLCLWRTALYAMLLLLLSACGGGGSDSKDVEPPPVAKTCETSDAEPDPNDDDCGQLLVGLTDADGDFLSYQLDVVKLTLVRSDGLRVEVLPTRTRVDFAQYVELTELVTAATVPVGRYVSSEITLDYQAAAITVEKNGAAVAAVAVDANGNALTELSLTLQLASGQPLLIAPGIPALLQLDFNLAASHQVQLAPEPVQVVVEPVLLASVEPLDERPFRIRGPLIAVNEAESFYRAAVRPFWDRSGRRGGVRIHSNADTAFLINGDSAQGSAGLTALAALQPGTATLAYGSYVRSERRFLAAEVWAGSSVPGGTLDAVEGVVLARDGNSLTVYGATLARADGSATFRATVTLTLDEDTRISKPRLGETALPLSAISVGQRLTALGTLTHDDANAATLAADAVILRLTSLGGSLQLQAPGQLQLQLQLQALAGLAPGRFNFAGTGSSALFDADPSAYEVATPNAFATEHAVGAPIRALGYVRAFGSAPADFDALAVQDYSDSRAQLIIGFGSEGSATPFSSANEAGLVFDLQDDALGERHHLLRGGLAVDLLTLASSPLLAPPSDGMDWYALRSNAGVQVFSDYGSFLAAMNARLVAGDKLLRAHALGGYESADNRFTVRALTVVLH